MDTRGCVTKYTPKGMSFHLIKNARLLLTNTNDEEEPDETAHNN
jgi:hypothetical protein